jgi:asparagine synthase (glutamine-hydrolysing)
VFFSAFVGPAGGAKAWEAALASHAHWLGHTLHIQRTQGPLPSGVTRAVARLAVTAVPDGGGQVVSANAIAVEVTESGFTVRVPPATPQPCYAVSAFGGRVLTDDLRLCASITGGALDAVGVHALLLWGQAPAPATLLRDVTRLPGGYRFDVDAKSVKSSRDFVPDPDPTCDVVLAERRLENVLDGLVAGVPAGALLFFSGGVDSALIAARAAAIGRTDIQLLNFAFGPDDPEAKHALRVASYLRLACERVTHDATALADVLDRLAGDYAFPFGDLSTLPTNVLVHAALRRSQPPAVIEGTGADGAFGLAATYARWRAVFGLPTPLRQAGSAAYRWLRLWRFNLYVERVLSFVRRSTRLGIRPAVLAQNSLDGIAFRIPSAGTVSEPAELVSPEERLSLLDLAWVCAGRMAPKTFDPLRGRGVPPLYPFLDPALIQVSTSVAWSVKSAGGEGKALLKASLAKALPVALVYRRKSGFTPPYRTTLATAPLQAFLHDVVLAGGNPMLEFCDVPTLRTLVARAGSGSDMSAGAVDFLWTLAFTSGWLRQLPRHAAVRQRSVA